jgi:glycosyltransferase involved in cell wall biosynthesis
VSLSVIMANYNHGALLPRSLGAILAQQPPADEIIIVDDGSTDDSIAVIERICADHPSIRLIRHDRNRGVAAAIETALAAVTGDFLLAAAADDFILPGLFSEALAALHAHPQAALFCAGVVLVDRNEAVTGFRPAALPRAHGGYLSPAETRAALRHSDNWFVGPSVVYRCAPLARIGYFDHTLGSMTDGMANRLLAVQHGFCFEPQMLAAWRVYPESFSARSVLSATESERLIATADAWIARNFPPDMRDWYRRIFDRRIRFNMARLRLVWRGDKIDCDGVAAVMHWGEGERRLLHGLAAVPLLGPRLVLAWLVLRARPYSFTALMQMGWRALTTDRARRKMMHKQVGA